jgi:hypothetical protein
MAPYLWHLRMLACVVPLLLGTAKSTLAQVVVFQTPPYTWFVNTTLVGDECFGNCGAGCSDGWNPCGGRTQYWDFTLLSSPEYQGPGVDFLECIAGREITWHQQLYSAVASATYHGTIAPGCIVHDTYCRHLPFIGCAWWLGCGDPIHDQDFNYSGPIRGQILVPEQTGTCEIIP